MSQIERLNSITPQIAKHLREVHFGKNWTWSNLRDTLSDVNWQEATQRIHSFNTIAMLTWHVNYYVDAMLKVLRGGPLDADDKFSFDLPPITDEAGWQALLAKVWTDAEEAAALIEKLPDSKLSEIFEAEKYGTWFRNLHGTIEHMHYHLGQIVIIKKLVRAQAAS